jgi:integrase
VFTGPDGKRWTDSTQIRRMVDACEAANLPATTFHDLRRTFGARLALAGVPMAVIAQALGHKDERITRKHYAHLSPSYVADTVRQHAAGMGIVQSDNVSRLAG